MKEQYKSIGTPARGTAGCLGTAFADDDSTGREPVAAPS